MKAIIIKEAGSVEQLKLIEIEKPVINDHEVLIKTKAISVNPVDVKARATSEMLTWVYGEDRPAILGWDISGEIIEIGRKVTDFKVGDEVFGMLNFIGQGKTYAEYVVASPEHITIKSKNVTHESAAASSLAALTAYQALVETAQVKKGDKVLVHAASGGVGHFAVQIAKYFGAYVIGTSSSKNKNFVLSLGADEHVDYKNEKLQDRLKDADIVFDTINDGALEDSIDVLAKKGKIVTITSTEFPAEVKEKAIEKEASIQFVRVASKKDSIIAISELLKIEAIKPHIHKTFAFEEMANAHLEIETGRVTGKVVIRL